MPHKSSTPHQFLTQLSGAWVGTSRTWLEPEGAPLEAPVQGSIQIILDGRFALYLYQTSLDNELQHGMYTFGFNTNLDRYEASWVDSFHNNTAIMFCTSDAKEDGFFVLGSYPDPTGDPDWGWRTEVQLMEGGHLIITAYNISPEGEESKATEADLKRVK